MSSLLARLKRLFTREPSYVQYIDAAHDVKDYENRMRSLGTLNANLLYLSKC